MKEEPDETKIGTKPTSQMPESQMFPLKAPEFRAIIVYKEESQDRWPSVSDPSACQCWWIRVS
jgi:hypothetical protein